MAHPFYGSLQIRMIVRHYFKTNSKLTSKIFHNCDLDSFYVSMIQFSGLKQSVGSYKPGSWGTDATTGHLHYQKFYGPQDISDDSHRKPFEGNLHAEVEPLSGCDYMYLCLQDITSNDFFNDPRRIASGGFSTFSICFETPYHIINLCAMRKRVKMKTHHRLEEGFDNYRRRRLGR